MTRPKACPAAWPSIILSVTNDFNAHLLHVFQQGVDCFGGLQMACFDAFDFPLEFFTLSVDVKLKMWYILRPVNFYN